MEKADKFRLLVVDDEESIRTMFGDIFEAIDEISSNKSDLQQIESELFINAVASVNTQYSYALTYCSQAEDAVAEVHRSMEDNDPFSCIFLDMRLPPGPDGLWAAEKIRVIDPEVNIVIVTGYMDVTPYELNKKIPPINRLLYLKKPIKPQEIRQFADALTKNWLESKKTKAAIASLRAKVLEAEEKEESYRVAILGKQSSPELQELEIRDLQDSLCLLKESLQQKMSKLSAANALLEQQETELEKLKIAIEVVLDRRQQGDGMDSKIKELDNRIMFNILEIAEPYIEKLESSSLNDEQREYLAILKKNLQKLTSPGISNLAKGAYNFTSNEVKLINLIRHGKTSKEIALIFNQSPRTVEYHRNNIRRKLGLSGLKGTSLNEFLRAMDL